jgi:hypothetical protein
MNWIWQVLEKCGKVQERAVEREQIATEVSELSRNLLKVVAGAGKDLPCCFAAL